MTIGSATASHAAQEHQTNPDFEVDSERNDQLTKDAQRD